MSGLYLTITLHLVPQVAYYCLYGRPAAGSNVKVRLADKHFPGLGVEVSLSVCLSGVQVGGESVCPSGVQVASFTNSHAWEQG